MKKTVGLHEAATPWLTKKHITRKTALEAVSAFLFSERGNTKYYIL
jgi:hypothetical protein